MQWAQDAYWIALGALVLLMTHQGSFPMARTILSILAVGLASLYLAQPHVLAWPSEPYALGMMTVDAIAATVVLIYPAGKPQAFIGLTFLLQIGVHAGRLLNGENADINSYWWGLSLLAILQLLVAGGWWFHDCVYRRRSLRRNRPVPAPANIEGMEG